MSLMTGTTLASPGCLFLRSWGGGIPVSLNVQVFVIENRRKLLPSRPTVFYSSQCQILARCLCRNTRIEAKAEAEEDRCSTSSMPRFEHQIDIRDITGETHESFSVSRGISTEADSAQEPLIADRRDYDEESASLPQQPSSSRRHAAADFFASTRVVYIWMINLAALCLYSLFIMPGILQVAWRYYFDKRIHRNIPYGQGPRNKLDLYVPNNCETSRPVVAFVSGGAWIIGYKAWGSLLALQLVEEDVIVVSIDYRNYPQGTINDMVEDVSEAISFVFENIVNYGGDLDRLYLVGQSAGAHLGACTLLSQVKKECEARIADSASHGGSEESLPWRASQIKAYIGISGCYNLCKLANHLEGRGTFRALLLKIMGGEESLAQHSPELFLRNFLIDATSLIPPIHLLHGTDDRSIPCEASTSFVEALTSMGVQATARLYEGKTHTDVFLQDPLRGGRDVLFEDILGVLNVGEGEEASTRFQRRMVPECLLWLAHKVSPF